MKISYNSSSRDSALSNLMYKYAQRRKKYSGTSYTTKYWGTHTKNCSMLAHWGRTRVRYRFWRGRLSLNQKPHWGRSRGIVTIISTHDSWTLGPLNKNKEKILILVIPSREDADLLRHATSAVRRCHYNGTRAAITSYLCTRSIWPSEFCYG